MDKLPQLCLPRNVPRPKRRTHGAAGAGRVEGAQAVDRSTLAEVSPQLAEHGNGARPSSAGNLAHPPHLPETLPQPWLIGSAEILAELERIRGLALAVPLTLASNGAVNSVVDALWRFEEELRYVLRLHAQGQAAFQALGGTVPATGAVPRSGAVPGVGT